MNTNTINTAISQAVYYVHTLCSLPLALLIGLSCIVLGYVLKLWPRFDNRYIPQVIVSWGTVLCAITAGHAPAGDTVVWYVRNALVGMIISFAAWGLHYFVLSRIEDKIPWLGRAISSKPVDPPH